MTRLITICLAAGLILACLSTLSYAGGEFLIPKKEFSSTVKCLRIEPVLDSLRESTVAMIEKVDKGFTFSEEGMKDPAFANYIAQTKQAMKAKYFLAATVLRLYEKNSRDSIKAVLNGKIRQALEGSRRFSVSSSAAAVTDTNMQAVSSNLRVTLLVDNADPSRSRSKEKAQACAVVLSAWVCDRNGKPLWHAQTEIAHILSDDAMGVLLNDQVLDDAVKTVFKTLIK